MPLDLNALGGFFSAELHEPASAPAPPWRSMAELVGDPAVLTERVEQVRRTLAAGGPLATVEPRVAASVGQLGLAIRLLSPALASAASGDPIDLDWTVLRWQPGAGGAFPLSVQPASATGFIAAVIHSMGLLNTAINRVNPVSPVILWGNVGSALNGAATVLARLRPELAEAGYDLTRSVLADGPAAMANPVLGPGFRRRSCCLLYRASPYGRAAICPDCVLGPG
jgi:hypothetical protein